MLQKVLTFLFLFVAFAAMFVYHHKKNNNTRFTHYVKVCSLL